MNETRKVCSAEVMGGGERTELISMKMKSQNFVSAIFGFETLYLLGCFWLLRTESPNQSGTSPDSHITSEASFAPPVKTSLPVRYSFQSRESQRLEIYIICSLLQSRGGGGGLGGISKISLASLGS